MDATLSDRACEASREHLRALPRRWAHVQAVAARAQAVTARLALDNSDEIVAAAWLHDIGYAADLAETGFHPVDGANFARRGGFPELVVALIAHHTGADIEADERGLTDELAPLPVPPVDVLDVVTFADMTTGPDGSPVMAEDRVAEILSRYPADDPVARAVSRSAPALLAAITRVQARLDAVGSQPR